MATSYVIHSSQSPSNKTEKQLIASGEFAYQKNIGNGNIIYALRPKLDKLSLVFDITDPWGNKDKAGQKAIKSTLIELREDPTITWLQLAKSAASKGKLALKYEVEVFLTPPGSTHSMLIQAGPPKAKALTTAFMRFEFNPGKFGVAGLKFFREKFEEFTFHQFKYEDLAVRGNVTRLDIACDLINVRLGDLIFRSLQGGKSKMTYSGNHGEIETAYLGLSKTKKNSDLYLYNKAKQLSDADRQPKYGMVPHIRIEFRMQPKRPIVKLGTLKNPLTKLELYGEGGVTPPEEKHHWYLFLDSCRYRGIDNALELVPNGLRQKYKEVLETAKEVYWRPGKLWEMWPEVLAASGLFEGLDL